MAPGGLSSNEETKQHAGGNKSITQGKCGGERHTNKHSCQIGTPRVRIRKASGRELQSHGAGCAQLELLNPSHDTVTRRRNAGETLAKTQVLGTLRTERLHVLHVYTTTTQTSGEGKGYLVKHGAAIIIDAIAHS